MDTIEILGFNLYAWITIVTVLNHVYSTVMYQATL